MKNITDITDTKLLGEFLAMYRIHLKGGLIAQEVLADSKTAPYVAPLFYHDLLKIKGKSRGGEYITLSENGWSQIKKLEKYAKNHSLTLNEVEALMLAASPEEHHHGHFMHKGLHDVLDDLQSKGFLTIEDKKLKAHSGSSSNHVHSAVYPLTARAISSLALLFHPNLRAAYSR